MIDMKRLLAMRAEMENALRKLVTAGELQAERCADALDEARSLTRREENTNVAIRLRGNITDIEEAIRRMDAGTFGTCGDCKGDIPLSRLAAIPWAVKCIKCKELLEVAT